MLATIAGMCGAILGAWAMIVASMFATTKPAAATFAIAARSSARLSASAVDGASVSGKCRPMSPSAAAPSSASRDRVQQHVGVGVPVEPAFERDFDAADDQFPPDDQRVHVEALPDSHRAPAASNAAAIATSPAKRHLQVA